MWTTIAAVYSLSGASTSPLAFLVAASSLAAMAAWRWCLHAKLRLFQQAPHELSSEAAAWAWVTTVVPSYLVIHLSTYHLKQ